MNNPEDVWTYAAINGLYDHIIYLHFSNFPGCTTDVMDYAAKFNHLNILYFLLLNRNEGCSKYAFFYASAYGHTQIIQTLYIHFPEKCNMSICMINAKLNKRYPTLRYLKFLQSQSKLLNCKICNNILTYKNTSSSIKINCKECYNKKRRNYKKQKKEICL